MNNFEIVEQSLKSKFADEDYEDDYDYDDYDTIFEIDYDES